MKTKRTRFIFAVVAGLVVTCVPLGMTLLLDPPIWFAGLMGASWGWFIYNDYIKALKEWVSNGTKTD